MTGIDALKFLSPSDSESIKNLSDGLREYNPREWIGSGLTRAVRLGFFLPPPALAINHLVGCPPKFLLKKIAESLEPSASFSSLRAVFYSVSLFFNAAPLGS